MRRLLLLVALLVPVGATHATASTIVDRNATGVKLAVNTQGEALVTYTDAGQVKHVLAWGAINAIKPTAGKKQVALSLDYSGGYGKYSRNYWQSFGSSCPKYTGPKLAWFVVACTAPDGSYWALQSWQRALPDYGVKPNATQAVWELHLSHWKGDLPVLKVKMDWAYRKFDHMYGSFTYDGTGVYGFHSTSSGQPLDTFGRNLYVDTYNSAYGTGWQRDNSFLTHQPNGTFCYGFYPHAGHPAGNGSQYRATIQGPGVTPDIMWQGSAPGPYDEALSKAAQADQKLDYADNLCKPV